MLPALAVACIFLAAVVITPAIGGPSVKKLAKKVSKALDLAEEADKKAQQALDQSGTPGPQGEQGIQGLQGPSALKLDFDQPETDNQDRTIGTQNELTFIANCGNSDGLARLTLLVKSSVDATINFTKSVDQGSTATLSNGGFGMSAGSETVLDAPGTSIGGFRRSEMQAIYRNDNRVISIDLHMIVNDDTGRCQVQGTAVPAPG